MKNSFIIFCLLIGSVLSSVAQEKDTEKFKNQFIVKDNPVKVSENTYDGVFNLYTVNTVKKIKRWNRKDWMVKYSSKIKEMVILNSIPMPKNMATNILNDVLKFCEENEYTIQNDDSGNPTNLFCKLNAEKITGLMIISIAAFAEGVEGIEVRCIDGTFSDEDVRMIMVKHGNGYKKDY